MKKKYLVTLLAVSMVLSFCGCGGKEAKQQAATQTEQDDVDDIEDLFEDDGCTEYTTFLRMME